jgi:hypothetical protein
MSAPLLALGLLWLPPAVASGSDSSRARLVSALRVLGVPLAAWSAWGVYTLALYGAPHFAGGLALVAARDFESDAFWNHVFSLPIYYGGALLFPLFAWLAGLRGGHRGLGLALLGLCVGAFAVTLVLPNGEPPRRAPLHAHQAILGALCFAGALYVWVRALRPRVARESGERRFLALWLAGALVFSLGINWHVNAADALLAAPPAILLLFRDAALRPGRRALGVWIAAALAFSSLLATSDVAQRDVYRSAARSIAREIGDRPGGRWSVGHWGLQYYLEREGFRAVAPAQYERHYGRSALAENDWVASARNVPQLDIRRNMARYRIQVVWTQAFSLWLPLRTTHADSGAGFYSHRVGYTPFAWSREPLERVGLGRVIEVVEGAGR